MRLQPEFNNWRAQLADDPYLCYRFGYCAGHALSDRALASVQTHADVRCVLQESAREWASEARAILAELRAKANSKEIKIQKEIEQELMGFPPSPILPIFHGPNGQMF